MPTIANSRRSNPNRRGERLTIASMPWWYHSPAVAVPRRAPTLMMEHFVYVGEAGLFEPLVDVGAGMAHGQLADRLHPG